MSAGWVALLTLVSLIDCAFEPAFARAESVQVERDDGARSCPDSAGLNDQLARLRPREQRPSTTRYLVHFTSRGAELTARITVEGASDTPPRTRVLNGRGPGCEGLAQATSLALALMLDADSQPAEPRPAPNPAPPVQSTQKPPVVAMQPESNTQITLAVGAGALLGVTQPIIPILLAEVGLVEQRYQVAIGALGAPVQRFEFAPGSLREWLLAGSLRGCLLPYRGRSFRIGGCLGSYVGVLDVRARGYTRNAQRKQLWAALPVELMVAYTRSPLSLELSAAALIPLRRPNFSLDGLGPAYESWPVAFGLFLRFSSAVMDVTKKK